MTEITQCLIKIMVLLLMAKMAHDGGNVAVTLKVMDIAPRHMVMIAKDIQERKKEIASCIHKTGILPGLKVLVL